MERLISFVIPCYNSSKTIQGVVDEIIKTVTIDDKEYAIDGLFIENGYTPNIDFIKSLNIKLDNNHTNTLFATHQ